MTLNIHNESWEYKLRLFKQNLFNSKITLVRTAKSCIRKTFNDNTELNAGIDKLPKVTRKGPYNSRR